MLGTATIYTQGNDYVQPEDLFDSASYADGWYHKMAEGKSFVGDLYKVKKMQLPQEDWVADSAHYFGAGYCKADVVDASALFVETQVGDYMLLSAGDYIADDVKAEWPAIDGEVAKEADEIEL